MVLLILFYKLFGRPSLEKFQAKKTFITESSRSYEDGDQPAVTVCVTNGEASGWKHSEGISNDKMFHSICNETNNVSECIKNNTYDLNEMVQEAIDDNDNDLDVSAWKEHVSLVYSGRCYSLNPSAVNIGYDSNSPFNIKYHKNITQVSIIHDSNFLILLTSYQEYLQYKILPLVCTCSILRQLSMSISTSLTNLAKSCLSTA